MRFPRNPVSFVLDNLTSGFNVGSAFRIADAFRADSLHLCGTTPTPPRPRITETSMGTERWVPSRSWPSATEALAALRSEGWHPVAVELASEAEPLVDFRPRFPVALVFGDELAGIGSGTLELCAAAVYIPMHGMGNSLSVSAAIAIAAHHFTNLVSVGKRLRQARQRAGLSLRSLSESTGVSYATICEIERGRRVPLPSTLTRLHTALGVEPGVEPAPSEPSLR